MSRRLGATQLGDAAERFAMGERKKTRAKPVLTWSREQQAAIAAVKRWLVGPDQVFRLFGYAGTGKTELARHLAEQAEGLVLFAAYTGKAAHILRQKGCDAASTIHKLIYVPYEKSRERLHALQAQLKALPPAAAERAVLQTEIRRLKRELSQPGFHLNDDSAVRDAELVVIDECSMVDLEMGKDVLSFGTKVLVLGDPAQLPPIQGGGFFTNGTPDVMLTEVHRQARDNPIIRLATELRQMRMPRYGRYGESAIVDSVTDEDALAADQLLVGRNATRHRHNQKVRRLLEHEGTYPVPGDRVVCPRNNHELGLLNGSAWEVKAVGGTKDQASHPRLSITVSPLEEGFLDNALQIEAWPQPFECQGAEDKLKEMSYAHRRVVEEFAYGYALTVHKAQGSQWENVIVFDESYCFREDKWKWLYTAVTRAQTRVTIVREQKPWSR
jgi:exodeoxyribonuclease V